MNLPDNVLELMRCPQNCWIFVHFDAGMSYIVRLKNHGPTDAYKLGTQDQYTTIYYANYSKYCLLLGKRSEFMIEPGSMSFSYHTGKNTTVIRATRKSLAEFRLKQQLEQL